MTVQELIDILKEFNPDCIVIMQSDPEGNSYSPLCGAEDNGAWNEDYQEYGYATLTEELKTTGYSEDDLTEGTPAVVLWPMY